MNAIDKIDKKSLKELLSKGWMTHDAMWLYHCLMECGIEKANQINKAAVESMSQIEIQRIKKALGFDKEKIQKFGELSEIMTGAMDLVKAGFMKFEWEMPDHNMLQWKWKQGECFAYKGISKLGVIDNYDCGIILRIEGWLRGLGVDYEIKPEINGCLMHSIGKCEGAFIFNFPE